MKMTTRSGLYCPVCKEEITLTTKGLLGGILVQLFVHSVIAEAKKRGATITCSKGHKFHI